MPPVNTRFLMHFYLCHGISSFSHKFYIFATHAHYSKQSEKHKISDLKGINTMQRRKSIYDVYVYISTVIQKHSFEILFKNLLFHHIFLDLFIQLLVRLWKYGSAVYQNGLAGDKVAIFASEKRDQSSYLLGLPRTFHCCILEVIVCNFLSVPKS